MNRKVIILGIIGFLTMAGPSLSTANGAQKCKQIGLLEINQDTVIKAIKTSATKDKNVRKIIATAKKLATKLNSEAAGRNQDLANSASESGWVGFDSDRYYVDENEITIDLLDRAGYFIACKKLRK